MDKTASICFAMKDPNLDAEWKLACKQLGFSFWDMSAGSDLHLFPCALIVADNMDQLTNANNFCTGQPLQKKEPLRILLSKEAKVNPRNILIYNPDSEKGNISILLAMAYNSFLQTQTKKDLGLSTPDVDGDIDEGTRVILEQPFFGAVVLQDQEVRLINNKARELVGIPPSSSAKSLILEDYIPVEKFDKFRRTTHDIISGELSGKIYSVPLISSNNKNIILQVWFSRVSYKCAPAILIFFTDMGELLEARKHGRQYEIEYFRIHKMAMVGKLASGLAHNLNTPVSIIQGNAELLDLQYPEQNEIKMILRQTARLGNEIHLLGIRGNKDLSTLEEKIDLNKLIKNEMAFLKANLYFKHYVECQLGLQENLPSIRGLYSDFSQVLAEIIENAVDAMYGLDVRKLLVKTKSELGKICLTISDSGKGMDSKTLSHLFEPFYTTKPSPDVSAPNQNEPRGTGLGLSMALSIINKYNGKITVDSKPGVGTVFTVLVPFSQN